MSTASLDVFDNGVIRYSLHNSFLNVFGQIYIPSNGDLSGSFYDERMKRGSPFVVAYWVPDDSNNVGATVKFVSSVENGAVNWSLNFRVPRRYTSGGFRVIYGVY